MRFSSIRARGLGPFREEVFVDLDAIDGKLVAITGPNGAGKSTLLEMLAGAMFRDCPTRGSLASLATSRDAFLEVGVVNGASHRLRHVLDAVSGKAEAVVTNADGKPLVDSGKLKSFDAWVAKHLPSPEVVYTSTFSAQAADGFLELKPADRKHVLLRLLGIERLEVLAEKARYHAKNVRESIVICESRISDERARSSDVTTVQAEIDALHEARSALEQEMTQARAFVEEVLAKEQVAKLARQDVEIHMARRAELVARLDKVTREKAAVDTKLANNRMVLARATEIRAAQARSEALAVLIAEHAESLAKATAAKVAAEGDLAMARGNRSSVQRRLEDAGDRLALATGRLADRARIERAVAELPKLRARVQEGDEEVARIEAAIEEAQALAMNSADARIGGLRNGLERILDDRIDCGKGHAQDALDADDGLAAKAAGAPGLIEHERGLLKAAKAQRDEARSMLAAAERLAARADEMAAAEADRVAAEAEIGQLAKEQAALPHLNQLEAAVEGPRAGVIAFTAAHQTAIDERASIAGVVKLADPLTQAEARVAELEPQAASLAAESDAITKDIDALGDLPAGVQLPDVDAARAKVESIRAQMSGTEAALAVKAAQLTAAHASIQRITALNAERAGQDEELSDWVRLANDLGKDGVQGLLIDAAGPEITEITNQLLHEAFGPRFTVRFDTVRRSSNGKKDLEAFDVGVIDTVEGRDANGETYSGGERVILNEAISLALTTLGCRRSGMSGVTLVRDESGAALDGDRARAYVTMLRRAAELIGAHQVLLVSHARDVQDLCDARIEIGDRKVAVTS